ncbi:NAD-P-binding protein [Lentinula raphanica]|uniref:NAD-P-binding protein n=1 Tax=Lentinula raphanica TaxID=153919 RepID=A0AA38P5F3_9AGAR|nr:NAD-P-binding protein [Lentinula raphanica]KAJ3970691.1 NAD-P-binding protein [Lentinula raphanica]
MTRQTNLPVTARHDVYPAISPEPYFSNTSRVFHGKVVLVVGASKGIGLAISSFYARSGAKLAIVSRTQEALDAAKSHIVDEATRETKSAKPEVFTLSADVTESKAMKEVVQKVVEKYGRLDIVIANAGTSSPWDKPFVESDPDEDWWKTLEVNLRGTYNVAHYSLLHLEKTRGYFVAVSSLAAQANKSFASSYAVSKTAVNRFIEYACIEHPTVKSFALHPGSIQTEMALSALSKSDWESMTVDTLQLPAATVLRLTDGSGRFDWLSGKFVSANWDLEEVEQKWKAKIINDGLLVTRFIVE